ncbi:hypothetical protein D9M68_771430 [compost metagenome]
MNAGSGKNLDWFWKRWFFDDGVIDLAIRAVDKTENGYAIQIENKSQKPLPIDLTITYKDGSTSTVHHTIGVWESGNTHFTSPIATKRQIAKVVMGSSHVPDKNRADNTFTVN